METIVIGLAWLSVAVFVLGVIYKYFRFSSMPLNLRWDIYPVPHEKGDKRHIGGSYMEEVDWDKKPLHSSLLGEIAEMASEIFFLKRVRKYNQYNMWPFSMAMHWGIYLLFAWVILLLVGAFVKVDALFQITTIIGAASFILGAFGCISLILKRATNRELSLYTTPVDYFNLLLLLSIFATGILSMSLDPSFSNSRNYIHGVVTFSLSPVPTFVLLNFILFEAFLMYMPFTKLLHYVAKYFNFHQAFWDDAFKKKGSAIDKKVLEQLSFKVSWSGPHIVPGKTWLEEAQIVDAEPKKGDK